MTLRDLSADRKNNLNIIRLFASLMVLYMHSFSVCISDSSGDITYFLTNHKQLSGGLAVDIFFIISGFLITRSYDRSKNLWSYIKARFLRIWPLLFVVVMVTAFIIGPIISSCTLAEYFQPEVLKFLRNALFINTYSYLPGVFNYHYNHSLNGSLWTLQYEVICYILVVLTAFIWRKVKAAAPAVVVILAGLYYYSTYVAAFSFGPLSANFVSNFVRLAMFFAMGMTYYCYEDKIKLEFKGFCLAFAGLVVGILFFDFEYFFALFGSYMIFYIAFQKHFVASWYDRVGDLSYGIYIMAFPIQQIWLDMVGHPTEHYNTMTMNPYLNMVLTILIVLPLSWFTWHYIEEPCLRLKNTRLFKVSTGHQKKS